MEKWYVRNSTGKIFGPIGLETLKSWVKDGRVEPLAGISSDLKSWMLAPLKPELEMNWIVENNPGQFYGPTHRNVLDDLVKAGTLSRGARFYLDDHGASGERIRALEAELAGRDKELASRDASLAGAQKQLAKRDAEIAATKQALQQRNDDLSKKMSELEQKRTELDAASKTLNAKGAELLRANDELARRDAEVEQLKAELARRDGELAEVRAQLAARDEVHEREWKVEVIEPEVIVANETPPSVARQAFGFGGHGAGAPRAATASSLAELERRAQEELSRMGASGVKSFLNRKK